METQTASHRVEELRVCDADGDDVRDVELEKVELVEGTVDVCVANQDHDEEGDGEEVEDGGGDGSVAPGRWCCPGSHDATSRPVRASRQCVVRRPEAGDIEAV